MRITSKLLLTKLFCLFFSFSNAQQKEWSLQECIEYALKNNLSVKQTELQNDIVKSQLLQAKMNLLPTLNANGAHIYNYGQTIDPFTNQFANSKVLSERFSLSSGVNLFSGFQSMNTIRQYQMNYLAQKYNTEKFKNDVAVNIASAYLQILFNQELIKINTEQLNLSKQQLERTNKLFDAGSIAKGTVLEVEAQVATEENNLIVAQNNLDLSLLNLAQMLDFPNADNFAIKRPEIVINEGSPILVNPESIYQTAVGFRPEIKSSEFNLKSNEKALAVARGSYSPSLMLSGSIGTGYSGASRELVQVLQTGNDTIGYTSSGALVYTPRFTPEYRKTPYRSQIEDNFNQSFGFSLSIPIFNGLNARTNVTRAKLNVQNAKYAYELSKLQLRKDIQQAYLDAASAFKKYISAQKAAEASAEAYKYSQQKFEVGMLNSFEFSQSKNRVISSESQAVQAKYDLIFKLKILDFFQGKPIQL